MSSLRAPWQNGPYTKTRRTIQIHVEHQDVIDIKKNTLLFVFFGNMISPTHMFKSVETSGTYPYTILSMTC